MQIPLGRQHVKGFTLLELMITIALLAILMAVGMPSFTRLLASWHRDSATKAIATHLRFARTEAIKSSQRVVVCNSSDASTCSTSKDKEWKRGWIIFQDINANNERDPSEAIMSTAQTAQGIQSLATNITTKRFVFLPSGLMSAGMCTLRVVPQIGETQKITLNRNGRVRFSLEASPS